MATQRQLKTRFPTLDALFAAMKRDDPWIGREWEMLPVYGGPTPRSTMGVWSWDETRLIVGTCSDDLQIVPRSYQD